MEKTAFAFEVKNLDEAGYIQGIAAAYGNVDFGNDRIHPGAFSKSLLGRTGLPMLLYHDMKRPIGRWGKLDETPDGLSVEGKISVKSRDGGDAYELAKDGALEGLSIGYDPVRKRMDGKVRELIELKLFEVSLVPIGMNPLATVTGVKDIVSGGEMPTERQFEEFLRDAGGFSKTKAAQIVSLVKPLLNRGEPDAADKLAEFYLGLRA